MWSMMVEFYPERFIDIGLKYKMSGLTVSHIWKTSCPAFDVPQQPIRTNGKRCQMFVLNLFATLPYLKSF